MQVEELRDLVVRTLEDMKAFDIITIDVRGKTSITDYFVTPPGTSDRHVKSTAESVAFQAGQAGQSPIGIEGLRKANGPIDLNGVVVHVMQARVRISTSSNACGTRPTRSRPKGQQRTPARELEPQRHSRTQTAECRQRGSCADVFQATLRNPRIKERGWRRYGEHAGRLAVV